MAKLDISNIDDTLTEQQLETMVGKAKGVLAGDLTSIKMTAGQREYIQWFRLYERRAVGVQMSGDDVVGDVDELPTHRFMGIEIEEVADAGDA